jgi:Spy/CpxP family protein refolding chaperone
MKRILGWSVLFFLLLFIAVPLAYPEPKASAVNAETEFQQDSHSFGPPEAMSGNMEPMMPCNVAPMRGMPHQGHHDFMNFKKLNLNEKQEDALKEIENDTAKDLIRKKADEQIAQIELEELLEKDTVDLKAVEKKLKQIEALKTEFQLTVIKSTQKLKAILTPQQLKIFKKMRPEGHPWMRPPGMGGMMHDKTKMPPPSERERGDQH